MRSICFFVVVGFLCLAAISSVHFLDGHAIKPSLVMFLPALYMPQRRNQVDWQRMPLSQCNYCITATALNVMAVHVVGWLWIHLDVDGIIFCTFTERNGTHLPRLPTHKHVGLLSILVLCASYFGSIAEKLAHAFGKIVTFEK